MNVLTLAGDWMPEFQSLTGAILAGGFIRDAINDDTPKDMDLFFQSERDQRDAMTTLLDGRWSFVEQKGSVLTLSCGQRDVQLIHWSFSNISDLVSQFDFTCCAVALMRSPRKGTWVNHSAPSFKADTAARILKVHSLPKPVKSLSRVARFMKRGWTVTPETLEQIAKAIRADAGDYHEEY